MKWSTKRVREVIEHYDKTGVMPKHNPFYERDLQLRKPKLPFDYTKKELKEMARCKLDILRFAETKAKVMTDEGEKKVKMRDYQKRVLLQYKKYRFNVFLASRQIGKTCNAISQIYLQGTYETYDGLITYNLKIPLFELYYEIKKRNTGKLGFLDKIKRSLYRQLCRLEGIHHYLYTEEWDKFTSYQNTGE